MERRRFWLGVEDLLTLEDIGRVVCIDHYAAHSHNPNMLTLRSHFGRIAGFSEKRGSHVYDPRELEEPGSPDISAHGDLSIAIFFEDGRSLTVAEGDRALVTFPATAQPASKEES